MARRSLLARLERTLEPEPMEGERSVRVYDALAGAHHFLDERFVRRVLRFGVVQGRALDVGCGSGTVALLLSQAAPGLRVVGLDLSEAMLDLARWKAAEGGAGAVRFVRADAKALPFAGQSFDLVVSHHTFHHVPQPAGVLMEMRRVARAGAPVVVRDLCRPTRAWQLEFFVRVVGRIYNRLGPDADLARQIYRQSLEAALSPREWELLAAECGIARRCVTHGPLTSHTDIAFRR
jgi:ubiquinone/menaquinone biosynthesis C-methylase UbiE